MNLLQNIQSEMRKYEAVECFEIQPGKVSTCSICFYLVNFKLDQASSMQLVSTFDSFNLNKHLMIK